MATKSTPTTTTDKLEDSPNEIVRVNDKDIKVPVDKKIKNRESYKNILILDGKSGVSIMCEKCEMWVYLRTNYKSCIEKEDLENSSFICSKCKKLESLTELNNELNNKNIKMEVEYKTVEKECQMLETKIEQLKENNEKLYDSIDLLKKQNKDKVIQEQSNIAKKCNLNNNNIKIDNAEETILKINNKDTEKDNTDIFVVGGSTSRHLAENLRKKTGKHATGFILPGGRIENVVHKLRNTSEIHNTLIVQVGTNDIGKLKEDNIKFKFRALLNEMKNRRLGSVFIGILPRATVYEEEPFRNKDAQYINNWLKNECHIRGIKFLDQWDQFFGNWSMYGRDGFHLSKKGKDVLAKNITNLLNENNFLV